MMFKRNLIRAGDPFQLSLAGRCHAAIAWLRGPALMRRWLLFVLVGAAAVAVAGVIPSPALCSLHHRHDQLFQLFQGRQQPISCGAVQPRLR